MKMENRLKFVIVGHVDHGKSTLIGRLLYDTNSLSEDKIKELEQACKTQGKKFEFAYIMDHLEEERDQNVTIDTSQTFFETNKRSYLIIDAPGHREFTKNMITGASQAEAAILIVDIDEGMQEQTKRHAYILYMLNLDQVMVVINKMDKVEYSEERYNQLKKEITEFLNDLNIKPSYIIPISAMKGDNVAIKSEKMEWYNGPTILGALDSFRSTENRDQNPLRMPVQDVYKIDDKRIIVGRVESGTIKKGQEILFLPSEEKTQIVTVEEFLNEDKKESVAGESTGIIIKDKLFIDRGQIICTEDNQPSVVKEINANIFWMSKDPFRKGETLTIKCGTQEMMCTLEKIEKRINSSNLKVLETDAEEIKNREVGEVFLKTSELIVIDDFNKTPELGRFVLEKDNDIVAGGIVTLK